jgi:hypothetical protein
VKRSRRAVVCAPVPVELNECHPFRCGEGRPRSQETRSPSLVHRAPYRGPVRAGIGSLLKTLRVSRVSGARPRGVNFRVSLAPPSHPGACLIGIALHPLATVGASLLRIRVRHRVPRSCGLFTESATPVHRTPQKTEGPVSGAPAAAAVPLRLLRERDSNARPSGYEPDELPLLHPAIVILLRRGRTRQADERSEGCAITALSRSEEELYPAHDTACSPGVTMRRAGSGR